MQSVEKIAEEITDKTQYNVIIQNEQDNTGGNYDAEKMVA